MGSLYLSLSFAVHLKLLSKKKVYLKKEGMKVRNKPLDLDNMSQSFLSVYVSKALRVLNSFNVHKCQMH